MSKPVIQIKIEGHQGSGKTTLAEMLAGFMVLKLNYSVISPASSYHGQDSFQLEDEYHIVQIRTKQTFSNDILCDLCNSPVNGEPL